MPEDKVVRTQLLSGHKVEPLEGEEAAKYYASFSGYTTGIVRLMPGGTIMPTPFTLFHDRIFNFKYCPTDVMVMTYPKCGTTWIQEIVWTLRNNPTLDHPMEMVPVNLRCPFMEMDCLAMSDKITRPGPDHPFMQMFKKACPGGDPMKGVFLQMAESALAPRSVKTHLPLSLMGKDVLDKIKVVYVMRNPKDLVVSFLHHCRLMRNQDFVGTIEEFVQYFVDGDLLYGHYDKHVKEALKMKSHPNLHIVHFEDMKADPMKELKRLNNFLGTERTEDQLTKIAHYTSFGEMKKRDNALDDPTDENGFFNRDVIKKDGGFFRKGVAGDWKEKLSPELAAKIDKWTAEKFSDVEINFRYS